MTLPRAIGEIACGACLVFLATANSHAEQHNSSIEWPIAPERLEDEADENWPIAVDLGGLYTKPNAVYSRPNNEPLTLDFYRPSEPTESALPCVVVVHGGAWRVNTKEWFAPHAVYLARAGYASATIDYRKLPDYSVEDSVEDAMAAVRWLRKNAGTLNIDPDRIGALGGSAGGHLVAVLATTSDRDCRANTVVGFAAADLGHPGLEPFYESLNLTRDEAQTLGAYAKIAKDSAPCLLVHGTSDEAVPVTVSKDLHRRYQQVGARSELKVLDGYQHVFYVTPRTFFEAMGYAKDFFDREL